MSQPALTAVLHNLRHLAQTSDDRRQTDPQLLQSYLTGHDEAAFATLVRRHSRLVLAACRRVLRDDADVEDAFQATFLVLVRRASSVRWQASIGNWLFGVAHRIAVQARANALRRRQRETTAAGKREAAPDLSWREALEFLHEELDRLPDAYRLPLLLCCVDGKTRDEAAQALACSTGAIKGRLQRGRELLRGRLLRRGLTLSGAMLAALVDEPTASRASPALIQATLNAARTGQFRPAVAALVKVALPLWSSTKTRLVAGVLLTISVLAVGGGSILSEPRPSGSTERNRSLTVAPPQPRAAAGTKNKDEETVSIRGRVLGPDDKPVAGANVYYFFHTYQEESLPVRVTTDAQGRFAFTLAPNDIPLAADARGSDPRTSGHVLVKAKGFTFAWQGMARQPADLTLRVQADETPVMGRIIDLEGKPLAGLRVSAWGAATPEKGDLTPFVQALQSRETFYVALQKHVPNYLHSPFNWRPRVPLLPTATTDADGRFRLPGFAKEQLIELRIEGPAIVTQNVYVMTRPAPRDAGSLLSVPRVKDPMFGPGEPVVVLANGFDHPVPPGQTVTGTVRDADTKQPISRAIVESYSLAGTMLAQNALYHTVADEQGRYRFTGLPRGKGNRIRIKPPADQPYLPLVKEVPAAKLFTEATVDVALERGVWVDVTALDKATGRPAPGSVSYFVLPDKPDLARPFERPFADSYNDFMAIQSDGTLRFVAAPRRAILGLRADWEKYPIAKEAAAIRLPSGLSPSNFQAFADINPKLGAEPVKVKFVLDAGRTVKGKLLDAEGKPLSGVLASGLRDDWFWEPFQPLKTAEFTARGLQADRPRLLCFVHPEKKLAGSLVVRGDETKPIIVTLQPWAAVSGRLLDADGKPLADAKLAFTELPVRKPGQPMSMDTGLHVITHIAGQPDLAPRTDAQGRFRVERLVPGLKYNLALIDDRGAFEFEQIKWEGLVFGGMVFKAGEAKELGDVKLQAFPKK